jgi:hypothetical protein
MNNSFISKMKRKWLGVMISSCAWSNSNILCCKSRCVKRINVPFQIEYHYHVTSAIKNSKNTVNFENKKIMLKQKQNLILLEPLMDMESKSIQDVTLKTTSNKFIQFDTQ